MSERELAAPTGSAKSRSRIQNRITACVTEVRMIEGWMCDGCPTGDDSGEVAAKSEAVAMLRWLDRRIARLTARLSPPNAQRSATGDVNQKEETK